jgi:hypothetical protein
MEGVELGDFYINSILRVIWKHMMYSMKYEMQHSQHSIIRNIPICVKDKPMQQILNKRKG